MSAPLSKTEALFNDIARFIDESRELLSAGAFMELAGMEDQVRLLCQEVLQLSQEERVAYAAPLQRLLGDMKALGEEMVARRERLGEEMRSAAQSKKAHAAYRTTDASDKEEEG